MPNCSRALSLSLSLRPTGLHTRGINSSTTQARLDTHARPFLLRSRALMHARCPGKARTRSQGALPTHIRSSSLCHSLAFSLSLSPPNGRTSVQSWIEPHPSHTPTRARSFVLRSVTRARSPGQARERCSTQRPPEVCARRRAHFVNPKEEGGARVGTCAQAMLETPAVPFSPPRPAPHKRRGDRGASNVRPNEGSLHAPTLANCEPNN